MESGKIAVLGPEGSGSRLVAQIIAHVIGAKKYGEWNGFGRCGCVYHKTFPTTKQRIFKDLGFEPQKVIITSRDVNCIVASKMRQSFCRTKLQAINENKKCLEFLKKYLDRAFIFSYETLLLYRLDYLKRLYGFIGVESDFIPHDLYDGNKAYLKWSQ